MKEQEVEVQIKGKGFKKFRYQINETTASVMKLNKELKKTNQLVKELIDLKDGLES